MSNVQACLFLIHHPFLDFMLTSGQTRFSDSIVLMCKHRAYFKTGIRYWGWKRFWEKGKRKTICVLILKMTPNAFNDTFRSTKRNYSFNLVNVTAGITSRNFIRFLKNIVSPPKCKRVRGKKRKSLFGVDCD